MIYDLLYIGEIAVGVAAGFGIFMAISILIDKYWRW